MTTLSPEACSGGMSPQSVWRFTETVKAPAVADETVSPSERTTLLTPAPQSYPSTTMEYSPLGGRAWGWPAARRAVGKRVARSDTSKVFMGESPPKQSHGRSSRRTCGFFS
jgi:hypothetical protein